MLQNQSESTRRKFFFYRLRALVVSIFFLPSANGEKVCPPALRPSFPQTLIESGSSGPYIAGRFASVFNLTFRHFGRMTRSWFSLLFLSSSSLLRNHVERPRRSSKGIQLRVGSSALMPLVLLRPFPPPPAGDPSALLLSSCYTSLAPRAKAKGYIYVWRLVSSGGDLALDNITCLDNRSHSVWWRRDLLRALPIYTWGRSTLRRKQKKNEGIIKDENVLYYIWL